MYKSQSDIGHLTSQAEKLMLKTNCLLDKTVKWAKTHGLRVIVDLLGKQLSMSFYHPFPILQFIFSIYLHTGPGSQMGRCFCMDYGSLKAADSEFTPQKIASIIPVKD